MTGKFLKIKRKLAVGVFIAIVTFIGLVSMNNLNQIFANSIDENKIFWEFQSIDTMKYSRDLAREKLNDPSFDLVIDHQVSEIAKTGATHIGIATPYDQEFLPFLMRWVSISRKYGLKVWFRGNLSGWEAWFGYPKITRGEHIAQIKTFIENNPNLFDNGDKFTGCPECENGGPGDPRYNNDSEGHRKFLIDEYNASRESFQKIGKEVDTRLNPMNGDVAKLIMDPATTEQLGGLVVIDHYVKSPQDLANDINFYAQYSQGRVVLGEFGAPIPDIHGEMSEHEQYLWLTETMKLLSNNTNVKGVNYWTNTAGSTELWYPDGTPKQAVEALKKVYTPFTLRGKVVNILNRGISNAIIKVGEREYKTDVTGSYSIPSIENEQKALIKADRYKPTLATLVENTKKIVLKSNNPNFLENLIFMLLK